ncbi:MAG: methyltransferase [Archangium sp.]
MNELSSANAEARFAAQRLAFAPLMFQACRALREFGILERLSRARERGLSAKEAVETTGVTHYAAALLLEAGLAAGLCACENPSDAEPRFVITHMGVYWLRDELTRVNAEFNHHVCYGGAAHLREALLAGKPAGLPSIDTTGAKTVYEALRSLPGDVKRAWFEFDHFYSDGVFEACLPRVLTSGTRHVVDIGANTGRFARLVLDKSPDVTMSLVDLPGQLAVAKDNLAAHVERITLVATNVLDPTAALPAGADVYWLSQFLDCFSESEIVSILSRVRAAMRPDSRVFILETFWDQQRHDAARFCVIGTSLYFACIANGNSRMYHSEVMRGLARQAGLGVVDEVKHVGLSHSLLVCGAQ